MFHPCPRLDCKYNDDGDCWFFTGDIYYLECLSDKLMYRPKEEQQEQQQETNNQPPVTTAVSGGGSLKADH